MMEEEADWVVAGFLQDLRSHHTAKNPFYFHRMQTYPMPRHAYQALMLAFPGVVLNRTLRKPDRYFNYPHNRDKPCSVLIFVDCPAGAGSHATSTEKCELCHGTGRYASVPHVADLSIPATADAFARYVRDATAMAIKVHKVNQRSSNDAVS